MGFTSLGLEPEPTTKQGVELTDFWSPKEGTMMSGRLLPKGLRTWMNTLCFVCSFETYVSIPRIFSGFGLFASVCLRNYEEIVSKAFVPSFFECFFVLECLYFEVIFLCCLAAR